MQHKHSSFLPLLHSLSDNQSTVLLYIDKQGLVPANSFLTDLETSSRDFLPKSRES